MSADRLCGRLRATAGKVRAWVWSLVPRLRNCGALYRPAVAVRSLPRSDLGIGRLLAPRGLSSRDVPRAYEWIGADNTRLGDGPMPAPRSQAALVASQKPSSKGMQ